MANTQTEIRLSASHQTKLPVSQANEIPDWEEGKNMQVSRSAMRVSGNIHFNNSDIVKGQHFKVNVGPKENCVSFIQHLKPLSQECPYFSVKITDMS